MRYVFIWSLFLIHIFVYSLKYNFPWRLLSMTIKSMPDISEVFTHVLPFLFFCATVSLCDAIFGNVVVLQMRSNAMGSFAIISAYRRNLFATESIIVVIAPMRGIATVLVVNCRFFTSKIPARCQNLEFFLKYNSKATYWNNILAFSVNTLVKN